MTISDIYLGAELQGKLSTGWTVDRWCGEVMRDPSDNGENHMHDNMGGRESHHYAKGVQTFPHPLHILHKWHVEKYGMNSNSQTVSDVWKVEWT